MDRYQSMGGEEVRELRRVDTACKIESNGGVYEETVVVLFSVPVLALRYCDTYDRERWD